MENEFGKWLGKSNGRTMISSIVNEDCTLAQFRAAVTTYCMLFHIEVDTKEWDDLIMDLFGFYNSWISDFNAFDSYMSELLV